MLLISFAIQSYGASYKLFLLQRECRPRSPCEIAWDVRKGFQIAHLDEAAYIAYQEDTTFRSSFVCEGCYGVLDSSDGTGTILGNTYGIAGASQGNKAPVYTAEKYEAYRLRQARKHGLVDG